MSLDTGLIEPNIIASEAKQSHGIASSLRSSQ